MTERKPPGVSFESFVDKQIREAEARGDFAALPGAGKPLPSLDRPYDELWWVRGKMRAEGLSFLPPSLVLRKEAEDVVAAVAAARSERQVRQLVTQINEKIRAAIRVPPQGPPLMLAPFDVEQVVADWRAQRMSERPSVPANTSDGVSGQASDGVSGGGADEGDDGGDGAGVGGGAAPRGRVRARFLRTLPWRRRA